MKAQGFILLIHWESFKMNIDQFIVARTTSTRGTTPSDHLLTVYSSICANHVRSSHCCLLSITRYKLHSSQHFVKDGWLVQSPICQPEMDSFEFGNVDVLDIMITWSWDLVIMWPRDHVISWSCESSCLTELAIIALLTKYWLKPVSTCLRLRNRLASLLSLRDKCFSS